MKFGVKELSATCIGILMFTTAAIVGHTTYMFKKSETDLEAIKTEIRNKDPERYAKTMEKAGMMTDFESKTFLWEKALKEMNDSLITAVSDAKSNYAKGSLMIQN